MRKVFLLILLTIHLFGNTIEIATDLFENKQQYKEAIDIFQKFKEDPESQYYLGKAYYFGMGVNKDLKKSFEYAKKSADKNNSSGLNLLGVMYQNGEGVKKDELKALEYYNKSADLNNFKAMFNLARLYANLDEQGREYSSVIKKDYEKALSWYRKAYELGNVEAAYYYGTALSSNEIGKDEEAIEVYKVFLDKYNENMKEMAAFVYDRLAWIYEKKKDYKKAYENYGKSVNLGNNDAILNIIYLHDICEIPNEEYLNWMKKGVELKLDPAYNTLYGYYLNNKDHKNLKLFLEKAYYEDKNFEMGCNLANYLSYDNLMEGNDFSITYNPKVSLKIINEIILKHQFHEKISSCYTTLAYFYVQGNYLEKNYEKAIEIYKQIKQNYPAPYLQKFSSESINDFESKIKEEKSIENNSISKNINDENNLFTVIENFSKVEQVATVLTSENYYFISTSDKAIKVIDKRTLQPIKELSGYISTGADGLVTAMAYDEKNKLLYCSGLNSTKNYILNDIIKVYDIDTGKIVKTIQNKKSFKNTFLNISKDGKYLAAINNNNFLNFINIETNEIQNFNLQSLNDFIFADIEKTSSDYLIHLVSKDYIFYTISHTQNKIISKEPFNNQININAKTFISKEEGMKILNNFESFVPINKLLYKNNNLQIELENKYIFDFLSNNLIIKNSAIDESNKKITVNYLDDGSTLEILKKNKKIGLINVGNQKIIYHKIIDNKYIFVVNTDYITQGFFDLNGNPLLILEGIIFNQKNLINNQNYLITYGDDNILHIWDKKILENSKYNKGLYDQNILNTFSYGVGGKPIEMIEANFSEEDLINAKKSMRINYKLDSEKIKSYFKFFMTKKESIKPLVSLYIKNENDWIMYTPEGLFTYGGNGKDLLKYHQNQGLYKEAKIVENDRLFEKFYRPDLIKKILAGEKVEIPMDVKSVILNILPPELKILASKMINDRDIDLTYQVCDAGNGIADPKLIINGQAINPPISRGFSIEKIEQNDKCNIYRSVHTLDRGNNEITFKAYDKDKNISNVSEKFNITANYTTQNKSFPNSKIDEETDDKNKSNLYFLSIAVTDYEDNGLDLKYSVKDVNAVKEKFITKSKKTFENIYSFNLDDKNVSKDSIEKIFDEISKKIKYNDTFVLYIAGHGITKDGKYQFLPYSLNEKISIDDLKQNLSKIYTNKSLVLLDTCQSGAAIENIDDEATKNRLAYDSSKVNYIVASSSNQVALEGYNDHGVFTYSVLESFDNNEKLKVWGLANDVSQMVPKITKEKYKYEQTPQTKLNRNFILKGEN